MRTVRASIIEDDGVMRRCTRNRAVAAATSVDAILNQSGFISNTLLARRCGPIKRYDNFEALVQERLKPDPNNEAREALRALQSVPVLRDELALLDDSVLKIIFMFLGEGSRDVARLGSVCRRLHNMAILLTPSVVVLAPDMVPLRSLSSDAVMDSLIAFFVSYKRGQFVQRLQIVSSNYASTLPAADPLPLCSAHAFPSLARVMPALTHLDMRGVQWEGGAPLSQYFFSDLHVSAPHLQTLKVGVPLLAHWSPGWWQRLPDLVHFVVGSRREQQSSAVPNELLDMLRVPQRTWCIKLWCAMDRETLLQILTPPAPFPGLQELTLNIANANLLEDFHRQMTDSFFEGTRGRKSAKRVKTAGTRNSIVNISGDADMCLQFPQLQSLTLANVDESPLLASELLLRLPMRAPRLNHMNFVNTARVLPPAPVRHRRLGARQPQ
ncbi:hypothetical protein ERJ75_001248500 [Trypanosoma vivax]|uniref:F-box domain-containing protein n=1 Tax=Trypanosoma vivax (strain Y486) TaxID=1055687 RepID=G0UD32_TRYVY|nr:hypothetical protein TRVL_04627 [Trypanosoma vivax]KAH8608985.1 hypothetical protein ERJ75_001248500 [Trypanosoma vivax]CCC53742.1 conserved hypothetical protein [Trypanosoma vivax Y486]